MNWHILYLHTKGNYDQTGAYIPKWYWRQVMQHWLLDKHEHARRLLTQGFDTVGVNAVRGHLDKSALVRGSDIHYSGNFWWATSRHLSTLKALGIPTNNYFNSRCQAENLILSKLPTMCAANVYSWNATHMYALSEIPQLGAMIRQTPGCDIIA